VVLDGTADATVTGSSSETVTVSTNQSVNVLTLDNVNATLAVAYPATLSAYGGVTVSAVHEIDMEGGTLLVGGASPSFDHTTLNLGVIPGHYATLTTDPLWLTPSVLTLGSSLTVNVVSGQIFGD
jgi:hypothetical protein